MNKVKNSHSHLLNENLQKSLYRLLVPLVRILHKQGIAFGDLRQLLKLVYVDVVESALVLDGQKPTTARIAIQTGLTRKDVATLRATDKGEKEVTQYHRVNRVINGWIQDERFLDKKGRPAVLIENGKLPSLKELIAKYSGDMPYNTMKQELLRSGAIEERGENIWELVAPFYLSTNNLTEGFKILGEDVALLIETIEHNLLNADDALFQRKVQYNNIPVDHIAEFRLLAARENQKLLVRLNKWLSNHDRDNNKSVEGEGRASLGVGVYYFEQIDNSPTDKKKGKS